SQHPDDVITYFFMLQETKDHRISFNINTTQFEYRNGKVSKPATVAGVPNKDIIFAWERKNKDLVIQRLTPDRYTYIYHPNGKIDSIPELDNMYCSFFDQPTQNNRLFFANKKAMYEMGPDHKLQKLCDIDITNGTFSGMFLDAQNRLWLNSVYHGAYIYDITKKKLDHLTNRNGLADNFTVCVIQDKQQTLWLGHARGLLQLKPQLLNMYNTGQMDPNIGPWLNYRGKYFYLNDHLYYLDTASSSIKLFTPSLELKKMSTQTFSGMCLDANGRICIADGYGDLYFYDGRWTVKRDPDHSNLCWGDPVMNPLTGEILVPKFDHLAIHKKDNSIQRWYDFGDSSKVTDIEHCSIDKKGNAWIVMDARLYVFNGRRIQPVNLHADIGPNQLHQTKIVGDTLFALTSAHGVLVYRINGEQLNFLENYTMKNGLASNAINSVIKDAEDRIWLSTFKGIDVMEIKNDGTKLVKHLSQKDGLSAFTWERSELIKDADNFIWCKTLRSFFRIDPYALPQNNVPPDVHLESIDILNKQDAWKKYTDTAGNFFSIPTGIHLPYSFSNLTFHFNALNLLNGEARYSYKLDGANDDWITSSSKDEVSYYNLEPGDYTFRVKAVNENGISSRELSYSFTIRPPFWKTWWFRGLMALVVVALIFWFIKRRERSIREQNRMELQLSELRLQALQSQMNPHFIFNSLNSIQSFIVKNNPIEAARYLAKFSALMRRILDNSHHQFQPLDTIIETLQLYVELESFRFSKGFTYKFDITDDPAREEVMLPPMLLQPFVENAIIHGLMPKAGEKHLLVKVTVDKDDLLCIIEDNGMGRQNAGAKKPGHISRGQQLTAGMVESLKTLRQIHASIEYVDLTNGAGQPAGTRVLIRIPTRNQK
ncbi:MAG TPA: histidine kinase, partial [Chitinophagaceae bacterium]|nr:histidine kinase [Chitinophagaceae bacterium]